MYFRFLRAKGVKSFCIGNERLASPCLFAETDFLLTCLLTKCCIDKHDRNERAASAGATAPPMQLHIALVLTRGNQQAEGFSSSAMLSRVSPPTVGGLLCLCLYPLPLHTHAGTALTSEPPSYTFYRPPVHQSGRQHLKLRPRAHIHARNYSWLRENTSSILHKRVGPRTLLYFIVSHRWQDIV